MMVKCPCCRRRMQRRFITKPEGGTRPGEVKYRCKRCDSFFIFSSWTDYFAACDYEYQKTRNWKRRIDVRFNPSFKRLKVKHD